MPGAFCISEMLWKVILNRDFEVVFFQTVLCVSLSSTIIGIYFLLLLLFVGSFFLPLVLQLRKCLPSLEINLGS